MAYYVHPDGKTVSEYRCTPAGPPCKTSWLLVLARPEEWLAPRLAVHPGDNTNMTLSPDGVWHYLGRSLRQEGS